MRRTAALAVAAALATAACNTGPGTPTASPSSSAIASGPSSPGTPSASASPASLAAVVARYGAQQLGWSPCGNGFQCATMTVPLDYAAPDGDTITVAVIKLPARKKSLRIGSVVLNPGGPGGSGIEFARSATQLLPGEILDRFDTVSFDPRGVGESTPVDCLDDEQLDALLDADPTPDTPTERTHLFTLNKQEADACQRRSATLLSHVATVDVAKDLDVLRAAIGDQKLTYVGFSYGTLLGARYASLFPAHIRALVLDGAVDPTQSARAQTLAQAVGFDKALTSFFADCVRRSCAFAAHGDIRRTYDDLLDSVEAHPLAVQGSTRTVGPSEAMFGVAAALYSPQYGWPQLRVALEKAYADRDGTTLISLFDTLVERDNNGHYSNSVEAQAAVSCVDSEYPRDPAAYDADAKAFAKQAPEFGPALAYGPIVCAYWPVPPVSVPGPIHAPGAPPIVVVGTTRDPATPYQWAVSLAHQLPATLLTFDGDGHTAYGYHRSDCIDAVVDAYLISLRVPKAGTRC